MDGQTTRRSLMAAAAGTVALAGCIGGEGEDDSEPEDTSNGDTPTGAEDRPAWQTTTFEDATTGETLSIADADVPVVLHTFATWCSICQNQQQRLDTLHEQRDDIEMVDLTIDDGDDPADVADHADSNGFGWRFGVSPVALTDSLVDDIGDEVAFAPQSPVIVVCPDGAAYDLEKGVSADEIGSVIDENCG